MGDPLSTSGTGAEEWGLWPLDPGPRGIHLTDYDVLVESEGLDPAGWRHDSEAWWVEERGYIMETLMFPIPSGRYVVTGGREVMSVLTIEAPNQRACALLSHNTQCAYVRIDLKRRAVFCPGLSYRCETRIRGTIT
ncbi:MAG: hypothetical protein CMM46_10250 [Rhodospirillaceae bacterium]|nr:hypothetical protein [Rhodospirillaceae bacterium]